MVSGRSIMVDCSPTTTAARLSRVIAKQTGMRHGSFSLYHGGRPMYGTLEQSGATSGSTIELKFRGRGGGTEPEVEIEVGTVTEAEIETNPPRSEQEIKMRRLLKKVSSAPSLYHGSRPVYGTLEESSVASGSTIELKSRGLGGSCEPTLTSTTKDCAGTTLPGSGTQADDVNRRAEKRKYALYAGIALVLGVAMAGTFTSTFMALETSKDTEISADGAFVDKKTGAFVTTVDKPKP